ncbi:hypothetical protein HNV08_01505 [Winogradskyella eckloniae]|uniref:Uncharacterized protein n=1 Tax=Winogradskyella litoriviva TaxID=1220182 RepID=A0ABX2E1E0_9FLAO|nr:MULTISPECIES: hypothetical protein [Winogradskyella]NRD18707.1 hypothetical protein [Winogradskyella eckloniae]NRD22280.1 hypothetical protein [Winogradskyella litoriviva]
MTLVAKKKALIQWISSVKDPDIINQIFEYKAIKNQSFKEELKDAISSQQLKEETTAYIKSLDWKK